MKKRSARKTPPSGRHRGDQEEGLEIVSNKEFHKNYEFNFYREFLTEASTNDIFDCLTNYSKEVDEGVEVKTNTDKKKIVLVNKEKGLEVKVKLQRMNLKDE